MPIQITLEADYAVRVIADLASRREGAVVPTEELGRRTIVPRAYLAKIVKVMARAGFVQTLRGARGGVRLLADPARISLRQVVEAIEGPISLNRCLVRPGGCPEDRVCPAHPVWQRIQAMLRRELDAVTMAALASRPDARYRR